MAVRLHDVLVILVVVASPVVAEDQVPEDVPTARVTLAGTVYDGASGAIVDGAEWSVDGTVVTRTDARGRYRLEVVPTATVTLEKEGYELLLVDVTVVAAAGDVLLLPLTAVGEVIEITSENPRPTAGAVRFQRDDIERIPGTGGDLLRSLDILPGITDTGFTGPGGGGVVIRGSAPEDSKILIDGFEVPLLYHALAQRSILPTSAIASLDYLPGGFDVSYGRASSGIVSVTTRGGGDRVAGQAEVAVIDGGVVGSGPIGKDTRVLAAARRSVLDLVLPSVLPSDLDLSLTTVPRFYDGQLRIDHRFSSRWRASVSAIAATDTLELYADDERDPDLRFYSDSRFVRLTAAATYYARPWSLTVAASGLAQGLVFEAGRDQYFDIVKYSGAVRSELTRFDETAAGLKNVTTRLGAELDVSRNELDLALPQLPDEGEPGGMMGPPIGEDVDQRFRGTVVSPDVGAWLATAGDLDRRIRLTTGLRVDGFARSGHVAVQPRGELAIALAKRSKLRLAAGAYRRPAEYRDELLDDTLAPERSTQTVLGLEQRFRSGIDLQTSLYYTDRSYLLTRATDGGYANQGRGRTYGAELLATYKSGPWFAWLSYSYARSWRRDTATAPERRFDHDQPHDLNLVASWRGKRWQFGGRIQYASGTPTTPVMGSVYDSDADRFSAIYGKTNSERLPGHAQLDLRIDRVWTSGKVRISAFLDVQNATANAQVTNYTYNYDYSERYELTGLPILPSIGIRGEL